MLPKPNRETYDRFVRLTGVAPERGAMFEDLSRNLLVPHDLGMATVLIAPEDPPAIATADDWETEGRDAPYVDFVIDDLAGFLEDIRSAARPRR
jgi:putative hydrolase of the HAD superfamily